MYKKKGTTRYLVSQDMKNTINIPITCICLSFKTRKPERKFGKCFEIKCPNFDNGKLFFRNDTEENNQEK